jgi:hypothetical protein
MQTEHDGLETKSAETAVAFEDFNRAFAGTGQKRRSDGRLYHHAQRELISCSRSSPSS